MTSKKSWLSGLSRRWRETIRPFLILVLSITAFRSVCADWNDVPTGSMNPSILEGDRIFVNKMAYSLRIPLTTVSLADWSDPKRFDIVVCFSPYDGTRLVKRVVGLPGDKIQLIRNRIFINDQSAEYLPDAQLDSKKMDSPHFRVWREEFKGEIHPIQVLLQPARVADFGPVTVPAGHYFLMGDNRDNSFDSRYFGCVERKAIIGEALAVVLSLDPFHRYTPRWQRFFSELR